jgi:hypothetical protein
MNRATSPRIDRKEATPMTAEGAFALGIADVAFLGRSPNRPPRLERGTRKPGPVAALRDAVRRGLARAAEAPVTDWMPRFTNYPY